LARRAVAFGCLLLALLLIPASGLAGVGLVRENGAWWLTDDSGGQFLSLGVNAVRGCPYTAKPNGAGAYEREEFYCWPRFYESEEAWRASACGFLESLGVNTRGGWSDPSPEFGLYLTPELDLGRHAQLHWFDPFDPECPERTARLAAELTGPYRHDPQTLGYFTDNEVGWWNGPVFLWYLGQGWHNATKQLVWNVLFERYGGDWSRLCAEFTPGFGMRSFDDLKKIGANLKLKAGGRGIDVVNQVCGLVARRYYELVTAAVHAADPEALVLGDRLPLTYNQDAVLAARGLLDVLSTNYNVDVEDGWVAPYYFEGLARLTGGMPVLVSEFFYAARENGSGNVNNGHLMTVATQAERAKGAAAAVAAFAAFPEVVGLHWFQMYDEPPGGREDGENYNFGLVDIHDRPYPLLADSLRRALAAAPAVHGAGRAPAGTPAGGSLPRLTPAPVMGDGTLADWQDKAGSRLLGFTTPAPYVPFGDVHCGWTPDGLSLFCLAQDYLDVNLLDFSGPFPAEEAFQLRVTAGVRGRETQLAVVLEPVPSPRFSDMGKPVWEIEPRLYRVTGAALLPASPADGSLGRVIKPLPHIAFEFFIPASALGLKKLSPKDSLTLNIQATNFYRSLTMSWPGPDSAARLTLAP